jgi:fumarylacetoacetase
MLSLIPANNPLLNSWIDVPALSDFPIQNIPFGIIKSNILSPRVATRIGDTIIDLKALFDLGYLNELPFVSNDFDNSFLNSMMTKGKTSNSQLRNRLSELLSNTCSELQGKANDQLKVLIPCEQVEMSLPVQVGDYTDFYSSRDHATNVGVMFRDPANALLPNWLWIPVGYHGRASSIINSGVPIHRPKGQIKPDPNADPIFAPCRNLDFELETAFITYNGKELGDSISTEEAEDYIFGVCLFNDWSARDIQTWEYVPLGPFLSKNFASTVSSWIVTLEALDPFRVKGPEQEPSVLSYLEFDGDKFFDINLEVAIMPKGKEETVVSNSNFKHMYWNMAQQLAHHTVNGCNVRCGDLMGSGTISGPTPNSYGSMLELAWKGTKPLTLNDGTERKFIQDGDTVIMRGHSEMNGVRIGFGELSTEVLPAR